MGRRHLVAVACASCLAGCSLLFAPEEGGYTQGEGASPDATSSDGSVVGADADASAVPSDASSPLDSAYASEVRKDGPRMYLRLGETTLPDNPALPQLRDEISTQLLGTRMGTLTPGVAGALASDGDKALQFDTGYISLGERFTFEGNAPFTIELWLRSTSNGFSHVVTKQDRGTPKNGWAIFTNDGAITFERFVASTGIEITATLQPGVFHHITATYDGTIMRLFINGAVGGVREDGRAMPPVSAPLLLATEQMGATDLLFQGSLDELAIYDKVVPQPRLQAHISAAVQK